MKLSEMLRQHLEWLDDEDGTMPFPEFEGETGWVSHDDGSIEDWGQYLLRLSLNEVAKLEAENVVLRNGLLGCAEWSHDKIPLNEAAEVLDALLTGEESEHE